MKKVNEKNSKVKICYKCKTELNNENWSSWQGDYICKDCRKKYHREYNRINVISRGNGKFFYVKKRDYPDNCELCGNNHKNVRLGYHHWDNSFPELGIWVCQWCHGFAEIFDRELTDEFRKKYLNMKIQITKKYIFKYNVMGKI